MPVPEQCCTSEGLQAPIDAQNSGTSQTLLLVNSSTLLTPASGVFDAFSLSSPEALLGNTKTVSKTEAVNTAKNKFGIFSLKFVSPVFIVSNTETDWFQ